MWIENALEFLVHWNTFTIGSPALYALVAALAADCLMDVGMYSDADGILNEWIVSMDFVG